MIINVTIVYTLTFTLPYISNVYNEFKPPVLMRCNWITYVPHTPVQASGIFPHCHNLHTYTATENMQRINPK